MEKKISLLSSRWMLFSKVNRCLSEEALWGRDPETSKHRETGTWKPRLFLCSCQLGLKKWKGPVWKCILLGECAASALSPTPVSLWLSNHSITEPGPVPRVHSLMNQGDYSRRFWSVSFAMFLHCDRAHDVCHFPTEEVLRSSDSLRFVRPVLYDSGHGFLP